MDSRDKEAAAALEPTTFELPRSRGRTLTYCLYGPDTGVPVILHYGTPGVRLLSPQAVLATGRWSNGSHARRSPRWRPGRCRSRETTT
jgi:hypothetical protein